MMKYFKIKI